MISRQQKLNEENFIRDYDGKFICEHKLEDDIKKIHRPLSDRENQLIEAFIKRQKELEK